MITITEIQEKLEERYQLKLNNADPILGATASFDMDKIPTIMTMECKLKKGENYYTIRVLNLFHFANGRTSIQVAVFNSRDYLQEITE